jgi:hypothetical protein
MFFIDDHDSKAIGINLFIGKRPTLHSATLTATVRCWNGPALVPECG